MIGPFSLDTSTHIDASTRTAILDVDGHWKVPSNAATGAWNINTELHFTGSAAATSNLHVLGLMGGQHQVGTIAVGDLSHFQGNGKFRISG